MYVLQEGAFLIRNGTRGDPCQPYTMCLFHDGIIFTLMIRRTANGKYALGKEKNGEMVTLLYVISIRIKLQNIIVPVKGVQLKSVHR